MSNHKHTHLPRPFPFKKPKAQLHVLTMYSNAIRYHARARLFSEFKERMESTPHVVLHIVEIAFGERAFEVTDECNPNHLQLRTHDELWHKENALNLLAQRLPDDAKYIAWLDSDIHFKSNPTGWALDAIHQLQHHHVIQMFDKALDLDVHGNVMHMHRGFVSSWKATLPFTRQYGGWHPGYGWAFTRSAWNMCGGLFEYAILGAGDDHMAKMLIGRPVEDTVPSNMHPNYKELVSAWRDHAKAVKLDIGFLPVTIEHYYHGAKANRKYWRRWDILRACPEDKGCKGDKCKMKDKHLPAFDPILDLKKDIQGLWQLTDRNLHVRDGIRGYTRQRNEDANH